MNVGELIVPLTPRPAPKPFANWVLPAPSSPQRQIKSPGSAAAASEAPNRRVASASFVATDRSRSVGGIGVEGSRSGRRGRRERRSSASAEPLEVGQRDRDGPRAVELDPAGLEEGPVPEPDRKS